MRWALWTKEVNSGFSGPLSDSAGPKAIFRSQGRAIVFSSSLSRRTKRSRPQARAQASSGQTWIPQVPPCLETLPPIVPEMYRLIIQACWTLIPHCAATPGRLRPDKPPTPRGYRRPGQTHGCSLPRSRRSECLQAPPPDGPRAWGQGGALSGWLGAPRRPLGRGARGPSPTLPSNFPMVGAGQREPLCLSLSWGLGGHLLHQAPAQRPLRGRPFSRELTGGGGVGEQVAACGRPGGCPAHHPLRTGAPTPVGEPRYRLPGSTKKAGRL